MEIGKLNKRITIEILENVPNEKTGFDDEKWIECKTVWASVNNLFGKEFWSAKAIESENTIEFIIRWTRELNILNSKKYRILWNSKIFNITFIDNIKYENKWIKIRAMEVGV